MLLVTGGSQGAASLNRAMLGAALGRGPRGPGRPDSARRRAQALGGAGGVPPGPVPYVVLPYLDRMDLGYAAADFVLCRAGAMTCAELTAVGLPAAYVPLPHGNGEQRLNAVPIEAAGGGLIVADRDLTPDWILDSLLPLLADRDRVAAMSQAAAAAGNPGTRTDAELADAGAERRPGLGRRGHRRRATERGR